MTMHQLLRELLFLGSGSIGGGLLYWIGIPLDVILTTSLLAGAVVLISYLREYSPQTADPGETHHAPQHDANGNEFELDMDADRLIDDFKQQ